MMRIIFGFLWEYIVGKDVRPGKAYQHHKFRIIIFLLVCVSLTYNVIVTKRLFVYYDAFVILEKRYNEVKERNRELEETNKDLEAIIIKEFKKPPIRKETPKGSKNS